MAMKESGQEEVWGLVRRVGNPTSSRLAVLYVTFVSEEQKQFEVKVNRVAPMLEYALRHLLSSMRSRAQVVSSLAERISLTRDIALYSLASY